MLKKSAILVLMLALMVASRRLFGDWADGIFIIIFLLVLMLYLAVIQKK